MNLVDSSCWLEYFAGSPLDEELREVIETPDELIVPSIVLLEVCRSLLSQLGEEAALRASGVLARSQTIDLNVPTALLAARVSLEHKLPLADAVIYATARAAGATLWTQDAHFAGLEGVRYLPRPPRQEGRSA